jgi:hypothetical protein
LKAACKRSEEKGRRFGGGFAKALKGFLRSALKSKEIRYRAHRNKVNTD